MRKGVRHNILNHLNDDILAGKIIILEDNAREKMDWLLYMYRSTYCKLSWSDLCKFASENSVPYLKMFQNYLQYHEFAATGNRPGDSYMSTVNPDASLVGVEYDILRYPLHRHLYLTADDTEPLDSFIGKTINMDTCAHIAKQLPRIIGKTMGHSVKTKKYAPEDIMWALKCIYNYKKSDDSWYDRHERERIVITGVRSGRNTGGLPGISRTRTTFYEECDRILHDNRSRKLKNRKYALDAILYKMRTYGYDEIACSIMVDHLVPVLNSRGSNPYHLGQAREWLAQIEIPPIDS